MQDSKFQEQSMGVQNSNCNRYVGRALGQRELGNTKGARGALGLYLNMPYRPVPRLVALFSRASLLPRNPRAPLIRPRAATSFTYVAVVMEPTDNDRGSRGIGQQQRLGGSIVGQGSGQGAMFGRSGFPLANQAFNPGYAGRGPYSGSGGVRYGGRGRHRGWTAQPRGGYGGHRGPIAGNNDNQSMVNDNRETLENRVNQLASSIDRDHQIAGRRSSGHDQGREVAPGLGNSMASVSTGSVSVGVKNFNLPEQAAVLLQKAFKAMLNTSNAPKNLMEDISTKGKAAAMLESVEDLTKPMLIADGAESSR
jgi:hypothetical protein